MKTNNLCSCDFCNEIQQQKEYIFKNIYNNVKSRIIYEDDIFIILPTIGQLFRYSLLVLPKRHIETMSELSKNELILLEVLLEKIKISLSNFGYVISFEHGAKEGTGGSCGIYHAHLHVIPVPTDLDLSSFFYAESVVKKFDRLTQCYNYLCDSSQYLMTIKTDGSVFSVDIPKNSLLYPSQFFRKKLVDYYSLNQPWDWREYQKIETNLLEAIETIHIN